MNECELRMYIRPENPDLSYWCQDYSEYAKKETELINFLNALGLHGTIVKVTDGMESQTIHI